MNWPGGYFLGARIDVLRLVLFRLIDIVVRWLFGLKTIAEVIML